MKFLSTFIVGLLFPWYLCAQQVPDTSFTFPIRQTAYQKGEGPVIYIDQAHHNMHTMSGNFYAFSKLLIEDGYRVQPLVSYIRTPDVLSGCKVLVIANALHYSNLQNWTLPTPSAFSKEEISVIKKWVKNGGSLLLIADHMPFAGAAFNLGKSFGFEFINGFAFIIEKTWPPILFSLEDQTLEQSLITKGLKDYEQIDQVATFTGSAFYAPDLAIPVLSFQENGITFQPDTAWQFNEWTPWENLERYHQGAIRKFGRGKIAVFGEAAMFTAQIVNDTLPVGFNSPFAPQNAQFTLNLIHWLDGVKEYQGDIRIDQNVDHSK
ncbi:MAG: hypothetical protein JXA23_11315 [Bacteroidales bacterium]|nr:hypothetical protein [Bacteroidales bacterium]